jgi:hypothetical protein
MAPAKTMTTVENEVSLDVLRPRPTARASRRSRRWLAFLSGCIAAILFMELALHNFSGKYENGSGFEVRDYREGFAKAHFSSDGLRLTGNPQIAGAPRIVILGDSHVEAYSVSDQETMGSILERRLRAAGKQWNVLQYGWRGADGPDYVYQAKLVMERFQPNRIFLVMTQGDLAVASTEYARLTEREGTIVAEPAVPGAKPGRPDSYGGAVSRKLKASGLLYASVVRLRLEVLPLLLGQEIDERESRASNGLTPEQTADWIVRGLKDGYGDTLSVLYGPGQAFSADAPAEKPETLLLASCRKYGLACRTLRDRMIEDLLVHHKIDRGAQNTRPGWGHFNVHGHILVANEIYEWLNSPR